MSSGTRSGPLDLARSVGSKAREVAGLVRRMVITRTRTAIWQVTGHRLLDGETETRDAELFGGIGFAARPSSEGDVEAIVAFPGGPGNPVIVATRQEAVRRVIGADLDADETQLHNSGTLIRIMADGTVEIRSRLGTAQPTIKGTTYRTAEDTMLSAIKTLATALASSAPTVGTLPQQAATGLAATAAASAITTFQGLAASFLTTVAKVE